MGTFLQINERADGQHDNISPGVARVPTTAKEGSSPDTQLQRSKILRPWLHQKHNVLRYEFTFRPVFVNLN